MSNMVIGLVGIGESPRVDIRETFSEYLGDKVSFREIGILDDIPLKERELLAGDDPNFRLVSRLSDGSQCILDKKKITPLINNALLKLKEEDIQSVVLLCTSVFPDLKVPDGMFVIESGKVIDSWLYALCSSRYSLGIIVPVEQQKLYMEQHYEDLPRKSLKVVSASPYEDTEHVVRAAIQLADCDIVITHCMGFRLDHKKILKQYCKGKILISNCLIADVIEELFTNK